MKLGLKMSNVEAQGRAACGASLWSVVLGIMGVDSSCI